ncbi:MAG: hypothetical protein LBD68_06870 [Zoogloeaceae bacterium]|jgi:hypothetical protein|nr:hypothetical protein [Zoogloeaceae bacterium]
MAFPPAALPFSEAIDYWRGKVKLPSSGWTDIWQEQHSHAFVVAGASHDALLEDLYNALDKARSKGGYAEFKAAFPEIAKRHGWSYNGTPGWRSRVIYDTNVRQSYNAGRYQQMMKVKRLRPFLRYVHSGSGHPRLEHKAWDGLILSADDPWWHTHKPSNGWGCGCTVESLSRLEAEREGGANTAPPVEWEERIVGKTGSNPRVVRVPKGIDPGFAYDPGKAWLEPHTVPPLTGYDAVLQERGATWPTGFTLPPVPAPTKVPASAILPPDTPPETAVKDFLEVFGATMEKGAVFTDAAGSSLAITKALFIQGEDKTGGGFKWLETPGKAERLQYINLMAMTLIDPDEIWWAWEENRKWSAENPAAPKHWRLKRRYLRAFEVKDSKEYAIAVFEWGRDGWIGSTVMMAQPSKEKDRTKYFNRQRVGRMVYKK